MNTHELSNHQVVDRLTNIHNLMLDGKFNLVVKESTGVFELVFKRIAKQALVSLPFQDRSEISQAELKIGKGNKGIEGFTFGELVGLFRETKLLTKWSKLTNKEMGLINTIDYSSIVDLRNRLAHTNADCTYTEASLIYEYLKNFLAVLGFADLDHSVTNSFTKTNTLTSEDKILSDKLPKIVKHKKEKSVYSSSNRLEPDRLQKQAQNLIEFDLELFKSGLNKIEKKTDLIGLDMGSARGFVTTSRFNYFIDKFSKVIGIDIDEKSILYAKENYNSDKYLFAEFDIESDDFEQFFVEMLESTTGKKTVDFIFSSLTIHHLANPLKAIMKLRRILSPGGVLILRGSDDGTKIGYPDPQSLINSLVNLTIEAKGVSDRLNGRKIYSQLRKTGFTEVEMFQNIKDTSEMTTDEKHNVFLESFSYRINYFKSQLESDPTDENFQNELEWVQDALEELEILFLDDSFHYLEIDTAGIALK